MSLEGITQRGYWQALAACHPTRRPEGYTAEEWTALFFPRRGASPVVVERAKRVCAGCPVREECLAEALVLGRYAEGVWGGLSQRQRRRRLELAARPRPPIDHGSEAGYRTHLRRGEEACERCREAHAAAEAVRHEKRRSAA